MDSTAIANALDELTGSWKPSGAATTSDLKDARLSLINALASGITPQAIHAVPMFHTRMLGRDRSAIDALIREAAMTTMPSVIPNVRSSTTIDPATAADFVGMEVGKTLGPFVDMFGGTHWIDLIPLPQKITISSATRGILGYLITDTPTAPTLGAGSIWIAAAAFDVPLLTSGTVGLSFSVATVKRTGYITISNTGVVTIGSGGTLTLDLTLAPPPSSFGTGRDATQMTLTLPSQVTIEFTQAGASFVAIDESVATAYGTSFTLKRNTNTPRVVKLGLDCLLFPCDASIAQFSFQTVLSTDIVPSGQSAVAGGGWALAITTAPPQQLGAASSAGSLVLEFGTGLSLRFGNLTLPTSLANATLALAPGTITIVATNGARVINDRLTLWTPVSPPVSLEPAPARHASEIDATIGRGAVIFANVSPQKEQAVASGTARANVDRPLAANGSRLPIAFTSALIAFTRSATGGKSVIIDMSVPDVPAGEPQPQSVIALENALLRVGPATTGVLNATYTGTRLVGLLEFAFENVQIVPTLPDPYASANVFPMPLFGTVTARVRWTLQPGVVLRFEIVPSSSASVGTEAVQAATTGGVTTLLDLSGNADQFGVSVNTSNLLDNVAALDGMAFAVPQEQLAVYALPGISWEPVVDQSTNDWLDASSADDGPPTRLQVHTVNLVRVEPNIALPAFAQAQAGVDVFGSFTLPFGLMATLEIPSTSPPAQRPSYSLISADFASGLITARQLSIRAESVINVGDPALPGSTTTGSPVPVPLGSSNYGVLALGNDDALDAAQFFDQEFSAVGTYPQIPVTRIDISGYGTSMFSDWKNPDLENVGVVRSRFDVLLGRTAHELVQIGSVVIPYCFRIIRTIIFDRYDSGLVLRQDTGLNSIGIGAFELLQPDQKLLGPIEFLENIHNIVVGTGPKIMFTSPDVHVPIPPPTPLRTIEFVPVTFDADVMMAPSVTAITNGNITRLVAGKQIQGYAQLTVGPVASAREILMAMQHLPDGVSGSVGCVLNVGSAPGSDAPKFTLNVSSLTAKATSANVTGQNYPAVAVALHGTPRLPRDGAWSITRRGQGDAAPTAVDPTFPVPLIFGSNNDRNYQWRLLDPADALSANTPNTTFGLLQGTGTSKSLFENPVIATSGQSLLLDPNRGVPPPRLADIGALLGAADIFPNLANVLQIPTTASDALDLAQDGFQKTFSWTIEKSAGPAVFLDDQVLLDLGVIRLVLQYHGPDNSNTDVPTQATFTVDANAPAGSPRWFLSLDHLSLAAFVTGFSPDALLTIHGGFSVSENQKPGFNNIQIDYGSALSTIKSIISGLTTLVEAMGGSVDLDVSFSDNKLTIHDGFVMPTIPLGLGEIEDIAIDLGMAIDIPGHAEFHVGLGSQDKPFTWIVDPLAGNGTIVLGTSDTGLGVFIEAGIGAALAIDLAIASGSASIILELSISTNSSPFALTAAFVGNASVDVLDGLASVSLTLAASIMIVPHWPTANSLPDLQNPLPDSVVFGAGVAVGIHLTIAWVASVDFDGSWAFSQRIGLHLPFGL